MKIVITIFLIFISIQIFSQEKKGVIKGSVYDKESKQPIESATLQVYKSAGDELVGGGLSDKTGLFIIKELIAGNYNIKVSYIGYSTFVIKNIVLEKSKKEYDAGKIEMEVSSEVTKEIEVTADVSVVENTLDKKVYNVENNPMNETGSVLDLLNNIPSIIIDADGKLSLRGSSNVQILIDGKVPAGKDISDVLDQLPASKIERIEIINNPTAKYDAEGTSGIINIVMKKGKAKGYSVNVNLNAGTLDKYNGNIGFNYTNKKINLYSGYSAKYMTMKATGVNDLEYFSIESPFKSVIQSSNRRNQNRTHIGNFGLDYMINQKNIISVASNYNYRWRRRMDNILANSIDWNNIIINSYDKYYDEEDNSNDFDIKGSYKMKFDNFKHELNTNFTYSGSWNEDILYMKNLSV
ncbi:MAG: carboxypeptidase regulatory-like domain-containing protein, partial [Ignavibacteriae bacterium]|nr:carboxypeptidase regulatory-like domain-containing protein [Ignavibacteriota bacterium]